MITLREAVAKGIGTESLNGLAKQVTEQLIRSVPAMSIKDVTSHVQVVEPSTTPYLQRLAAEALIAAIQEHGKKPVLKHALRTLPEQYAFWKWHVEGRGSFSADMPGSSTFENGVAIEIDEAEEWVRVLRNHNWQWSGARDSNRFHYYGAQDPRFKSMSVWAFQTVWNRHNPGTLLNNDGVFTFATLERLLQSPAAGF